VFFVHLEDKVTKKEQSKKFQSCTCMKRNGEWKMNETTLLKQRNEIEKVKSLCGRMITVC
jgi:hypothetical protein